MREIKFRLRDRHNKIVGYEKWYRGVWHPDNLGAGFSLKSGYWEASPCWLYSVDGDKWTPTFIPHRYKDQYTGLKDKTGKEIYEGDICRVTEPDTEYHDSFEYIGDVRYSRNRFYVHCPKYHPEFESHNYEVIGNIWKNKELLEASND